MRRRPEDRYYDPRLVVWQKERERGQSSGAKVEDLSTEDRYYDLFWVARLMGLNSGERAMFGCRNGQLREGREKKGYG